MGWRNLWDTKAKLAWWIGSVAAVWLLLALGLVTVLRAPEFIRVADIRNAAVYDPYVPAADAAEFRRELQPKLVGVQGDAARAQVILQWVDDQVGVAGPYQNASTWRMVQAARSGQGLICGPLSRILADALQANGIRARRITLFRNFGDFYDTHATVEALIDGKWRVYDPTFDLDFRSGGQRVGLFEARDYFLKANGQPVEFHVLGPHKYPVRLDTYPHPLRTLLNNAIVEVRPKTLLQGRAFAYDADDAPFVNTPYDAYRLVRIAAIIGLVIGNLLCAGLMAYLLTLGRRAAQGPALRRAAA